MDLDEYRRSLGLRLTPKQRAFAESYVENGGDTPQAALQAYDCGSRASARVMAHKALHNPKVLDYLAALMQPHHIAETAVDRLSEALGATKQRRGKPTGDPDWPTRLRAAHTVLKLHGLL